MRSSLSGNPFQFFETLRAIAQLEDPIDLGLAFKIGQCRGFSIETLAGMAGCHTEHVIETLLLVDQEYGAERQAPGPESL